MKRLIIAAIALVSLSGCATALTPRPGESPCVFGRRVIEEAQRRVDQARRAAETVCPLLDLSQIR